MEKMNFIKTTDKETKETLLKEGFKLIAEGQGVWTFLNDAPTRFSTDNHKITQSNILTI